MCTQRSLFVMFCLLLASVPPIVQTESVANASVVLSMCQAIATKTAKILLQQRNDYVLGYWKQANNIGSYVNMWSDRVKSYGGDPTEVGLCTWIFNQTVYSQSEGMSYELLRADNARMGQIDGQMFEIFIKDMKQETMEKYVNIVKGISENSLKTSKVEGDMLLKTTVKSLKAAYKTVGSCLRNLMIKANPMAD